MKRITVVNPFNGHDHFRDEDMLKLIAFYCAQQFSGGIVMPNPIPPITTTADALAYSKRIIEVLQKHGVQYVPCMTLYLTDKTKPEDVVEAFKAGIIVAIKFYPSGATTNSEAGVSNIRKKAPVFTAMAKHGIPLCIHGETMKFHGQPVDVFDREKVFLSDELLWLTTTFPDLKIVMEHITTREAVNFLTNASDNVWATVTAHHLLADRNDMLGDGINPHLYCKPILKRVEDKKALRALVTSGFKRVGLGTDSAAHHLDNKECACGYAGVFTAVHALEHYVQVFDEEGALQCFEGFATRMAGFYEVKFPFTKTVILEKKPQVVPEQIGETRANDAYVIPYKAGEEIPWSVKSIEVT